MSAIFAILAGLIFILIMVPLISAMPTIHINTLAVMDGGFYACIRAAAYFLPMDTISAILGIIFILFLFRILVSVLKLFKSIIPFM